MTAEAVVSGATGAAIDEGGGPVGLGIGRVADSLPDCEQPPTTAAAPAPPASQSSRRRLTDSVRPSCRAGGSVSMMDTIRSSVAAGAGFPSAPSRPTGGRFDVTQRNGECNSTRKAPRARLSTSALTRPNNNHAASRSRPTPWSTVRLCAPRAAAPSAGLRQERHSTKVAAEARIAELNSYRYKCCDATTSHPWGNPLCPRCIGY
jgi:hypothetical protein